MLVSSTHKTHLYEIYVQIPKILYLCICNWNASGFAQHEKCMRISKMKGEMAANGSLALLRAIHAHCELWQHELELRGLHQDIQVFVQDLVQCWCS